MRYTTMEIAQKVGGLLDGPGDLVINGMDRLDRAQPGQITFVRDAGHGEGWAKSQASAALVNEKVELPATPGKALIRVKDADVASAAVLELFAPPIPLPLAGVHATATVDPSAALGANVAIGPNCVVGANVAIGEGTVLQANVTVMDDTTIGAGCLFWPGVVVRERCMIGDGTILHSNVSIGTDGFGYRPAPDGRGLVKIPQIGTVEIGRGVEIGSNSCVDRGKFGATVVGDGCKIDNLVQIAHNCELGRCVIIAGCSAIAGSVIIGDGAILGGNVAIKDQITIGAGATIAGSACVMNDVPSGETWAGYPAKPAKMAAREYAAMRKLPDLARLLKDKARDKS